MEILVLSDYKIITDTCLVVYSTQTNIYLSESVWSVLSWRQDGRKKKRRNLKLIKTYLIGINIS